MFTLTFIIKRVLGGGGSSDSDTFSSAEVIELSTRNLHSNTMGQMALSEQILRLEETLHKNTLLVKNLQHKVDCLVDEIDSLQKKIDLLVDTSTSLVDVLEVVKAGFERLF